MARANQLAEYVVWMREKHRSGVALDDLREKVSAKLGAPISQRSVDHAVHGRTYRDLPGAVPPDPTYAGSKPGRFGSKERTPPTRPHSKYTPGEVRAVRELYGMGLRRDVTALIFGMSPDYVLEIMRGRVWADLEGPVSDEELYDLPLEAMLLLLGAEAR